jgi:hypothetical protein
MLSEKWMFYIDRPVTGFYLIGEQTGQEAGCQRSF